MVIVLVDDCLKNDDNLYGSHGGCLLAKSWIMLLYHTIQFWDNNLNILPILNYNHGCGKQMVVTWRLCNGFSMF